MKTGKFVAILAAFLTVGLTSYHEKANGSELDPNTATIADLRGRPCGGTGQPACDCSDHLCDRGDCEWHWDQSRAADQSNGANFQSATFEFLLIRDTPHVRLYGLNVFRMRGSRL